MPPLSPPPLAKRFKRAVGKHVVGTSHTHLVRRWGWGWCGGAEGEGAGMLGSTMSLRLAVAKGGGSGGVVRVAVGQVGGLGRSKRRVHSCDGERTMSLRLENSGAYSVSYLASRARSSSCGW